MIIKQAVILAGGQGIRLRPFTDKIPKPMILINGRPFLEYLIEMLKGNGIEEVVLLLGYLPEKITEHFGDGSRFGVKIKYSITDVSDKTGRRIKKAKNLLDDNLLLMYCDNYWPLNLKKLSEFYLKQKTLAVVTVYNNKDGITQNNIFVDAEGYVTKYDRSRKAQNLNGVEIGFFAINKKVLKLMPNNNFSFEEKILPQLVSQKQLAGFQTDHRYYSISTPERVKLTEEFLSPKKVVFLDRDGVINKKPPRADYVKKWEEFKFLPGATEALKILCQNGYQIFLISNQPGIARGMMTKEDLNSIQKKMAEELGKNDIKFTGSYYCLHGWDEGCACRKPKPGLLFQAAREHNLDLSKAVFIGDDKRDMEAGKAAGCKTIFLEARGGLLEAVKSLIP